jgi:hypothetical protein
VKEHDDVEIRFKWLLHIVIYVCVNGDFNGLFCILDRPSLHSAFLETHSSIGLYILPGALLYVLVCGLCKIYGKCEPF